MKAAKPEPQNQVERFKQAARELGTDQSEKRFREMVRKVASAPPAKNEHHPRRKTNK